MDDITVRPLPTLDDANLALLDAGYTTREVFAVSTVQMPDHVQFDLRLTTLDQPFVKQYPPPDAATRERYAALAREGHVFGAFVGVVCVGIAITEPYAWNQSLWVHEFHIAPAQQRHGVGRLLMERVIAAAQAQHLRCVVCETQNTNIPAIRFYRALGFTLDGLDLSLYSNYDRERGEIVVYLKRPVDAGDAPS
jgi:ribosomal protein S18 acetylase RimI-like enzyme